MEKLSSQTLQSFCRACLKKLKQRQKCKIYSLNLQIRHWLEDATLDKPLAHDRYPNSICYTCRNKLKEFLEFHEMCKQSRKTIYEILANDEENKLKENPKTNKLAISELEENMLEYKLLAIEKDAVVDPNSIVIDTEEPLICSGSLNRIESKYITQNIGKSTSHCTEVSRKHSNSSEDDYLVEREEIQTDSGSDIRSKDNDMTRSLKKKNKLATKMDDNFSDAKVKRKKYIYSFRCDRCKQRCVSQQTLDIHMRTHYGLKPYQCPKCDDAFDKSIIMLKHLHEIHGEKRLLIVCEYKECSKHFTSTRSYKDHYRKNHITPPKQQQSNQKQDKFAAKTPYRHVCEECGKIYTKLQTFKEHQYTHGPKELYPFQCDECDKAFVKQRTFNEHKLRHAGIKNFECPHCGAKKTTKKELRSHMNSHTRERQYPCPHCPMIFYRSSNRRIHVDVVHQGIRRFACRFCDQTFGKGDNLKNHELLHTGEKPHACTECGKRFVQRVSLRSHMKTHSK